MEFELGNIIIASLIALATVLSFAIGSNDETTAPLAAVGTLKFKVVLIIGGVGIAFGTIFLSEEVANTVGENMLGPGIKYSVFMLLSVLISSILWLIVGSFAGIPLSSTHSLFGSIFGVVIVYILVIGGVDAETAFNWDKLLSVVGSWFVSPLAGFLTTYVLYKIISKLFLSKLKGLNQIEDSERKFAWALLGAVFTGSIYTGANSAEALGILYALFSNGSLSLQEYWFFKVLVGIFAFIGLYFAGRYVIRNLASQMTDSRPSDGFILQVASALILAINTILGLPISHSHVIVFSIIGLNAAQKKEVDYKGIGKMAIYWVLTLPIAGIFAGLLYFGFISFGFY